MDNFQTRNWNSRFDRVPGLYTCLYEKSYKDTKCKIHLIVCLTNHFNGKEKVTWNMVHLENTKHMVL